MRTFSSYGPVSHKSNYFVPRTDLVRKARDLLLGTVPGEGGHYFTVWAPRQCGKSWVMREIFWELGRDPQWHAAKLELEGLRSEIDPVACARYIVRKLNEVARLALPEPDSMTTFEDCFTELYLDRPLVLILDEFDALPEDVLRLMVSSFRNLYLWRQGQDTREDRPTVLLHGLALIGVRSVVGVDNPRGSPFNVQRSLQIPGLTREEVLERLWHVTQGQPGLVGWFGELLTERFNEHRERSICIAEWNRTYLWALRGLPNNTVMNLISKARPEPYRQTVLELFRTGAKVEFRFEEPELNYLYMNGVITFEEEADGRLITRFPCQFVQEKLFDHFSAEIFPDGGQLLPDPFMDLAPVIDGRRIDVPKLLELYGAYLRLNRDWLLKDAPRRSDLRVCEAVYHFSLYAWLSAFLQRKQGQVIPEFPTGNGKIDLLLRYAGTLYGIELKSFTDFSDLPGWVAQAGRYAASIGLARIVLAVFVERELPAELRPRFARPFPVEGGAEVELVFLVTG